MTASVTTPLSALLLHGVSSSSDTWWRQQEDLHDLGWETLALDLAGHGGRPMPAGGLHGLADLVEDVWEQVADRRFDVVVGHSLGAVVALALAAARPGLVSQVVAVDPPALGGSFSVADVAAGLRRQSVAARADVDALTREVAAAHPRWTWVDATGVAHNALRFDDRVATWLEGEHWDLADLVVDCPVPVSLLLADGPETATVEPVRSEVVAALAPGRVIEVVAGHGVHRDRPALFLRALLELTARARGVDQVRTGSGASA